MKPLFLGHIPSQLDKPKQDGRTRGGLEGSLEGTGSGQTQQSRHVALDRLFPLRRPFPALDEADVDIAIAPTEFSFTLAGRMAMKQRPGEKQEPRRNRPPSNPSNPRVRSEALTAFAGTRGTDWWRIDDPQSPAITAPGELAFQRHLGAPPSPLFPPVPFRPHPQVAPLSTVVPLLALPSCILWHPACPFRGIQRPCHFAERTHWLSVRRHLGLSGRFPCLYLFVLRPTAARLRFLLDRCEDRPLVVAACELDNLHGPASAQCNRMWVHVICTSNASNAAALTTTERSG